LDRFIGRKEELAFLERIYSEENLKTCMVTGRRRIGKTVLITRFIQDKPSIYIKFDKGATETINLRRIVKAISKYTGEDQTAADYCDAMEILGDLCSEKNIVVVFDELPYLVSDNDMVASELQHFVDHVMQETKSMVIVCGSSISLMEDEVKKSDKPLYGRFFHQLSVRPFTLEEIRGFHPSMSDEDLLRTYLILGGIPYYHDGVGDLSFPDIVDRYLLRKTGFIRTDVRIWIMEELKSKGDNAMAILEAISSGNNTYGSMQSYTGLSEYHLYSALDDMDSIGLVSKRNSMIKPKKSVIYEIVDRPVSFCYDVVERNDSILENRSGGGYESLRTLISTHLGKTFEGFCRDYVMTNYPCSEVGSWWGDIPVPDDEDSVQEEDGRMARIQTDIDVVATIHEANNRIVLFGECKFTKAPVGFKALNDLKLRVHHASPAANARFALFSLSGFTDELIEYAEDDDSLMLFDLDVLLGKKPLPSL
jgi:hypothetical protein